MLKPRGDENPIATEFAILGRKPKHMKANSHREENTKGRRPIRVLRAMKMKNAAIKIKMSGITTLSRKIVFIAVFCFANVRDHRHRTAGATSAGSAATKHSACQRVGVRWIALLAIALYCLVTRNLSIWPASSLTRESGILVRSPPHRSNMGEW